MPPSGVWAIGVAAWGASVACGGASPPPPGAAPPAAVTPPTPPAPTRRLVRVSYLAPSDCPTVDGYSSQVRERSVSLELEARGVAGGDAVDVRIDPELERPGWLGQLRIEGSRPLVREVRGDRCEDVVEALALITVLWLEGADAAAASSAVPGVSPGAVPSAEAATSRTPGAAGATGAGDAAATSAEPVPPNAPAPQPPPAESAPSAAAPEQAPGSPTAAAPAESPELPATPAEPAPAPEELPSRAEAAPEASGSTSTLPASPAAGVASGAGGESEPPPLQPDEPITRPAGSERVEADTEAGAEAGAESETSSTQLAPTLALLVGYASVPGHALEISVASEVRYGDTLGSWTSPIALTLARGNERVDAADLDFTLLTAQLGLCPPAPLAESWAWLRVCANVRGGAVRVQITPRVPQLGDGPAWRPWLAAVPSLEMGIPFSERWTVRASAELAVQLVRDTFGAPLDAEPDPAFLPLYRPEAVSVEGGLGVGYTF